MRASALLSAALWCAAAFPASPRDIDFAGIKWGVKSTAGPVDPGPNTFSNAADQVWTDGDGALHLTLRKRGQVWTAAEVMAKRDTGYGTYRFDVSGSVADLDPHIVFGFLTWDKAPESFNRELDIELSRWGDPGKEAGWFTVQPYGREGNQHSFDLPKARIYSFSMIWTPGSVSFSCEADGETAAGWTFRGETPDPGRARLRLNLWLFRGREPADPGPYEAVVRNLVYEPLR